MAKKFLGLRLDEHDSNISYFDGDKVHYLKSERLYNIKWHAYNNLWSWQKDCEKIFGINLDNIDEVAIIIDPWTNKLPMDQEKFYPAMRYKYFPIHKNVWRVNHHLAHALSCWPLYDERPRYEIVIDGEGDDNQAWTVFKDNKVFKEGLNEFHGSIGLRMKNLGIWLNVQGGYDRASKLMGLQSYGKLNKEFKNTLNYTMYEINKLFDINNYIAFLNNDLLAQLQPLEFAKTVHTKVGELLVDFFSQITNNDYDATISYSGGVAQNVIWNTQLKKVFKNLIIPPHCSDEGLSLGAIEYLRIKNNLPKFKKLDNYPYIQSDEKPNENASIETIIETAEHLKNNKIVAWYQYNGEIGPRALGNRSLLLNPLIKNGKDIINKIKKRETYRPFGASILKEYVKEYFDTDIHNPYMLYVGKTTKDNLKCITHVDGTCRFQSVDRNNKLYYDLLNEFYRITKCPLLLNTSFNVNGKPIMSNIKDAKDYFYNSDIDVLVVGNKIYKK